MRSLAEIIIIMPMVESTTRIGNSKRIVPWRRSVSAESRIAAPAPSKVSTFMKRAKPSTMKPLLKVSILPVPETTSTA